MIGTREAAARLNTSPDVVCRLIREGQLEGRALYPNRRRPTYVTTEEAIARFEAGLVTVREVTSEIIDLPPSDPTLSAW